MIQIILEARKLKGTRILNSIEEIQDGIKELINKSLLKLVIVTPEFKYLPIEDIIKKKKYAIKNFKIDLVSKVMVDDKNEVAKLKKLKIGVHQRPEADLFMVLRDEYEILFGPYSEIFKSPVSPIAIISDNPIWITHIFNYGMFILKEIVGNIDISPPLSIFSF